MEILKTRRHGGPIVSHVTLNDALPRILYHVKVSFIHEGAIKSFSDKLTLKEFVKTRSSLQEVVRTMLHMNQHNRH